MAAVTVTSYRTNIPGSYRERFYTINIANSGDTLATPAKLIRDVSVNDGAITKSAVTATSTGSTITFTTTGAVTGALVSVVASC